jgi:hypothetical protein
MGRASGPGRVGRRPGGIAQAKARGEGALSPIRARKRGQGVLPTQNAVQHGILAYCLGNTPSRRKRAAGRRSCVEWTGWTGRTAPNILQDQGSCMHNDRYISTPLSSIRTFGPNHLSSLSRLHENIEEDEVFDEKGYCPGQNTGTPCCRPFSLDR